MPSSNEEDKMRLGRLSAKQADNLAELARLRNDPEAFRAAVKRMNPGIVDDREKPLAK